jgi:hypothetical protein
MRNARGIAQTGTGQDIAAASLIEDDARSNASDRKTTAPAPSAWENSLWIEAWVLNDFFELRFSAFVLYLMLLRTPHAKRVGPARHAGRRGHSMRTGSRSAADIMTHVFRTIPHGHA